MAKKYVTDDIAQQLVDDVKTRLNGKVDKSEHIYKPGGSKTFATLPAASASTVGFVYNVTDSFTTTSDFVEGAGIEVEGGTDVAVIMTSADPATYKYNLFGGSGVIQDITPAEYEEMWKDPGVLTLSDESVSISGTGTTENVTVTEASGAVSASSSDTDIATVVVSGTTIAITSVATGSATITVESASTTTNRKTSKDIAVTVSA